MAVLAGCGGVVSDPARRGDTGNEVLPGLPRGFSQTEITHLRGHMDYGAFVQLCCEQGIPCHAEAPGAAIVPAKEGGGYYVAFYQISPIIDPSVNTGLSFIVHLPARGGSKIVWPRNPSRDLRRVVAQAFP